jgi:hypothetical protein
VGLRVGSHIVNAEKGVARHGAQPMVFTNSVMGKESQAGTLMQKSSVNVSNEFKKKPAVNFSQSSERTKTAAKTPIERTKPVDGINLKNQTAWGGKKFDGRVTKINMMTED